MRHPTASSRSGIGFDAKMTPMIDVIFQLLIFFLCTAGFSRSESVLPTELPQTGPVESLPSKVQQDFDAVRIQLLGDGKNVQILLNGRPLADAQDLFEQMQRVARVSNKTPVVLDVAGTVPFGPVVEVYDGVLSSGLVDIHFAASRTMQ